MSQGQMQTRLAWLTVRPQLKENLRRTLSDPTGNGNSYCVVFLVSVGNVLKSTLLDHSSSTLSLVFVDGITAGVQWKWLMKHLKKHTPGISDVFLSLCYASASSSSCSLEKIAACSTAYVSKWRSKHVRN